MIRGRFEPGLPGGPPLVADEGSFLAAAARELVAVQRSRVAGLLREAAALALERSGDDRPFGFPLPAPPVDEWKGRALRAIGLLEGDGVRVPGQAFLGRLARADGASPGATPAGATWEGHRAAGIARKARSASRDELSELALGFALLASGRRRPAEELFLRLLRRPWLLVEEWRALQGLAYAHLSSGRLLLASGAMEAAADDPECDAVARVDALALALLQGDARGSRRAAARLDLLVDADDTRFVWALDRLPELLARSPLRPPATRRAGRAPSSAGALRRPVSVPPDLLSPADRVAARLA